MPDASKNSMPADNSINDIAPARDGNIAIIEEFEAAKTKNTIAAYDLFIARHPDHELVAEAKKLRLNVRTSPVK